MPGEISISAALSINRNGAVNSGSGSKSIDQTGTDYVVQSQNIGSGATEPLNIGDIGTLAYIFVKNLDATNYVRIGINTPITQIFSRLKPGEFFVLPVEPGVTYYAQAN